MRLQNNISTICSTTTIVGAGLSYAIILGGTIITTTTTITPMGVQFLVADRGISYMSYFFLAEVAGVGQNQSFILLVNYFVVVLQCDSMTQTAAFNIQDYEMRESICTRYCGEYGLWI